MCVTAFMMWTFKRMPTAQQLTETCGLYYKHTTIVNDAARVIRMMIVSDATTWSATYDHN
jgi:hypothetical protein